MTPAQKQSYDVSSARPDRYPPLDEAPRKTREPSAADRARAPVPVFLAGLDELRVANAAHRGVGTYAEWWGRT